MLTQLQDVEEHHNIVLNGYDFGASFFGRIGRFVF